MFRFAMLFFVALNLPAQSIDWSDPDSVVAATMKNHPRLLALEASARSARELVKTAGVFPNPMLMAGIEEQPLQRDSEMKGMYVIGASQTLPNRDRLRANQSLAELAAERIDLELAVARAELRRDVLLVYWDLAEADSQLGVIEKSRAAAQMFIDAARLRYETGEASQSDVIRAQLALTNLDHEAIGLRGRRAVAAARLAAISGDSIGGVPAVHLPHGSGQRELPGPVAVSADHPAVLLALVDARVADEEIRLARALGRPDVAIDAEYGMRTDESDMVSVVARVELPLRKERTVEPRVRAALVERDAAAARAEALRRSILEGLAIDAAVHSQANEEIRLHEAVLIPQTRLAFEAALASYEASRESFSSVSESYGALLRIELDYYGFLARHIKAITDFEALRSGARTRGEMSAATAAAPTRAGGSSRSAQSMGGM